MCCSENCQIVTPFCVHHTMETPFHKNFQTLLACQGVQV
jgi:hypothetical protein